MCKWVSCLSNSLENFISYSCFHVAFCKFCKRIFSADFYSFWGVWFSSDEGTRSVFFFKSSFYCQWGPWSRVSTSSGCCGTWACTRWCWTSSRSPSTPRRTYAWTSSCSSPTDSFRTSASATSPIRWVHTFLHRWSSHSILNGFLCSCSYSETAV